ncbi:MAG: ABC transporter permease [Tenericutes bacterium GWC2_34_14]|nr:MAG: ABC transporter permease [Tenericutes bacterium GWC2_34_14]OHE33113.1 MAG: ABC transporter permease [Tenericutes bacterium GWE2_34_108]OHE36233.1 MAG: ABC transporter permease [Tenericutes bacterium GWF1_35_14]OHE38725.1 MAG: ABC transporter permease [Tenericutes bacterium GWF2_35_184]OHE44775.1 MAG: ABC transporter permease [Tenericutes bacterium RIFOXYA2_FULL_36_32]OHE48496.1 MAG: ABC transporter permease [Tenericutes bacterium RIFOXYB2_FULL_36_25]OHE48889.1 MAG: ABC transporter per
MKTMKKVWRYVTNYKKLLFTTLTAMLIVQALGLLSPLIVKSILDDYLVGIERPWYEVSEEQAQVTYQDRYFSQDVTSGDRVSVVIYEGKYYFSNDEVIRGHKELEGSTLTITSQEGQIEVYEVTRMSRTEVIDFYQPFVKPLTFLIILLTIRFFLQTIFTYIQRITTSMINVNIVRDARKDAVKALQKMPMTYFETEPAGKIANRIISDVAGMMNLFSTIMNLLVNASLAVIFAYIGMFYLDARLALMTFLIFPVVYVWLKFFTKRLNKIAVKVNEQSSMITAQLNEIINGINILQIFNFRKQTEDRFNNLSNEFMQEKVKENILHLSIGWNMIRLIGALVTAIIVLYFGNGYLTISGFVVSAGIIYAYNDYLSRLIEPVGTLFREIGNLEHARVRTDRIFKIIDGEQEDGSFEEIPRFKGHIKFDNIWFSYSEGHPVLKGIDLEIKPGQMVGLVGHTGSGKSSLMSLLMRFYDMKHYDMGKILVDDIDITTYSKRTYRTHVGIVLQDPAMFKGTIADNIRFGQEVSDERIEEILRDIGGSKLLDKLEKGIHTMITRGGGNLSVGEKQIISFARAVVHNPAILVMDEATANIDTETETMLQEALETVKKGRTMVVIAHRLSTIKNADKIVVLENGIKVEEGRHRDLLSKNGVYANIYRSQIKPGEETI